MAKTDQDIANDCYRKGTEAMGKGGWDYAINMFSLAITKAPKNILYRQARHGCIRKKYDDNGTGMKLSKMKIMGPRGKMKKAQKKKDWAAADKAAEDALAINPWDAQTMFDLGKILQERGCDDVAVYALTRAVEYERDNIEFNRGLGELLLSRGEFPNARSCYERIYKLNPEDAEARKALGEIDAKSVLDSHRGGYEEAATTKDVKVKQNAYEEDRQARKAGMQAGVDGPGQSEEADLQRLIRKEPEALTNYLKLADFYKNRKQLKKAYDVYMQALENAGDNDNVREEAENVELDMIRTQIGGVEEQLREKPDSGDLKDQRTAMRKKLLKREIEVLSVRIERYPQDLRLKYNLANCFKRAGRFTKAIPLFQQASADIRIKEDVLVGLGECFIKEKKLDLGRRQFEKAIQSINPIDKEDLFKTAHYWLGRLYEKANQIDKADAHYSEILAVDYDYKDTLTRLEAISGGSGEDEIGLDD